MRKSPSHTFGATPATGASSSCAGSRAWAALALGAALVLAACSPPPLPPRGFDFFMKHSIARDGVLARCDEDEQAAQRDLECANARRAAMDQELAKEKASSRGLERESERKLEALRKREDTRQAVQRDEQARTLAQAKAAYEARWAKTSSGTAPGPAGQGATVVVAPAEGAPAGLPAEEAPVVESPAEGAPAVESPAEGAAGTPAQGAPGKGEDASATAAPPAAAPADPADRAATNASRRAGT